MKPIRGRAIERLVGALNGDILRELRLADACISQASHLPGEYHPVVRRQIALCASAALSNATALAVAVLELGGVPVLPGCRKQEEPSSNAVQMTGPLRARAMLAHYRARLHMAERLNLLRLREVFHQIVGTKERLLAHSGFIQDRDPASRYLYT